MYVDGAGAAGILVEVKELRTYFDLTEGTVRAVDGVSFQVSRARTLGVVGESGCGKSVTARSIMNMIRRPGRIVGGQILYHRRRNGSRSSMEQVIDLVQLPPMGEEMRAIRGGEFAMIFQEPKASFSPVHTVGSQIVEAIVLHQSISREEARERAVEMLRRVSIPNPEERIDAYPHQLSGGMCQRAMIALALSCRPDLLIADEPTTALDVTTEAQILDLIQELQETYHTAVMYITHNLAVLAEIAHEVVVMYMGRDVEQASTQEIFENPLHPYTRALLRSIPRVDQDVEELAVIRGRVPDPYAIPRGCPFHPRCGSRKPVCSADVEVPHVDAAPGHRVRCHLYS
ncbi:MAG: ABC transporter ATP-binding protein [Anaerolineae bacterium]|nr:ABC transporter ATP-binding protein [Anaerolineae bacterium]